jgi:O-antigen/teichoic acid export membrane protein
LVAGTVLSLGAAAFLMLGLLSESDPIAQFVFLLFGGALVARGLATFARHSFVAFEAAHYHWKFVTVFRTGEVLLAIVALLMGASVIAIAAIHLVSWILEGAAGLALIHRRLVKLRLPSVTWVRFRDVAFDLLAISFSVAAGNWLYVAPLALIRYVAEDASDVGQFALAWNAAVILSMMLVTVMNSAFPVVSRAHARSDGKDVIYMDFCVRYGVVLGAAAAIFGMVFGPWAITVAIDPAYARAGPIFTAALALLGPIVVSHALDQTLYLQGRTGLIFVMNGAALAAIVVGFVPAFREFGPAGAVYVVSAVLASLVFVKVEVVRRVTDMVLLPSLLRATVASGAALAATVALSTLAPWVGLTGGLVILALAAMAARAVVPREFRDLFVGKPWRNSSDNLAGEAASIGENRPNKH